MTKFRSEMLFKSRYVLALAIWLASAGVAQAATFQTVNILGLKVAVWLPAKPEGAVPVILFSHAFQSCNTQSKHLMEALADEGYAVFAPNHKDAVCKRLSKWLKRAEVTFMDADKWDNTVYADRGADMRKLLDAIMGDKQFAGLDRQHVGVIGHSLGGYTALAVAGAWPAWKDSRITAVVALSPYCAPFVNYRTLPTLNVPVMYQGGSRDVGNTPSITKPGGAYDVTSSPKILVDLDGAGHFAWTDTTNTYNDTINDYDIAFFDYYLKGKPFPEEMLRSHQQVRRVWSSL